MKITTVLLLNLIYAATTCSATEPTTIINLREDLVVRDAAPAAATFEYTGNPNWYTVTEFNSPSTVCDGSITNKNFAPLDDPNPRSFCKNVADSTTRILWETKPPGYLVTFAQPNCAGPIKSTHKLLSECFAKGPDVLSYEAWH